MFGPVFLPGKVHGQKSRVGCSPWGYMTACVHEGGGWWVGSNKLVELKKNKMFEESKFREWELFQIINVKQIVSLKDRIYKESIYID